MKNDLRTRFSSTSKQLLPLKKDCTGLPSHLSTFFPRINLLWGCYWHPHSWSRCLGRSILQHSDWTITCLVGSPTGPRNLITHTERLLHPTNINEYLFRNVLVREYTGRIFPVGPEDPFLRQSALWKHPKTFFYCCYVRGLLADERGMKN